MEVRVLGELQVLRGGHALELPPSKKTRALLAYLVVTGTAQRRQRLCELLWDGPDDPRAALRWSLTKLRALAGTGPARGIVTAGDYVTIELGDAAVDARLHRADFATAPTALDTSVLKRAAARFRGEFLEGLDLPDCYRFQEWCVAEREMLRRERIAILWELVRRLGKDPGEALPFARERLSVDPLAESGHVDVVRLLGALGQRREALDQYERARRVLKQEVGIEPSAALEQARMAIGGPSSLPLRSPAAPSAEPEKHSEESPPATHEIAATQGPLFGREAERTALIDAVATVARGERHPPLLITGEPGLGKTRLLEDLVDRVRASGGLALVGRAFETEMIRPYGAWIDALRSVPMHDAERVARLDLAALLPEVSETPARNTDRVHLFDAVVNQLALLATKEHPAVVVLDDIHWIDEVSAALIHYVARAAPDSTLLLLAARPGELEDNPAALRLVRALRRENRLRELRLGPLGPEDTKSLVRSIDSLADPAKVHADSEGNPLFAIELGRARAGGETDRLPATLETLLRERIERLDERSRALVGWAATLGRSFDLALLGTVSAVPVPELLSSIDDLERRGVFRSSPAGTTQFGYDFSHDLLRRAAYLGMPETRRRLCHSHVAGILEAKLAGDDGVAGPLARHAALGGRDELAAHACAIAGRRCLRVFAYAEAMELADRGRRHARKVDPLRGLGFEIELLAILVAAGSLRRRDELDRDLRIAIATTEAEGRHDLAAAAYRTLAMLQHHRGEIFDSAESLDRGTRVVRAEDPSTVVRTLATAGRCYAMVGRELPRARALLAEATALATANGIIEPEIGFGMACLRHFEGDAPEALRQFRATHAVVRRASDHWLECECLMRMTMLVLETGEPEDARSLSRELTSVAQKMGNAGSEMLVAEALLALSNFRVGDADAASAIAAVLVKLRDVDAKGMLGYVLTTVAASDCKVGRIAPARRSIDEAIELATAMKSHDDLVVAMAPSAELHSIEGELTQGEHAYARAISTANDAGTSSRARAALEAARIRLAALREKDAPTMEGKS